MQLLHSWLNLKKISRLQKMWSIMAIQNLRKCVIGTSSRIHLQCRWLNGVGEPITEQCCWISPWSLVINIRLTLHSSEHYQMHGSGTVRATLDLCIISRHVGIEMGCHPFRLPGLFLTRWTLSGSWKSGSSPLQKYILDPVKWCSPLLPLPSVSQFLVSCPCEWLL